MQEVLVVIVKFGNSLRKEDLEVLVCNEDGEEILVGYRLYNSSNSEVLLSFR
jgi:hypothetical protein